MPQARALYQTACDGGSSVWHHRFASEPHPTKGGTRQLSSYRLSGDGLGRAFRELGSLGKEVDQAIAKQDNVINVMMPEATAQFMKSEQERYARIVKKADVKLSDRGYP